MKIALAQIASQPGALDTNQNAHLQWIQHAHSKGVDMVVFPELSLSGYEPTLAKKCSTNTNDARWYSLQKLSDNFSMCIVAGAPITQPNGICIASLVFRPNQPLLMVPKAYLHQDETPFFIPGKPNTNFSYHSLNFGLAICYELALKEHEKLVFSNDIDLYMVSAVKFESGIDSAQERLRTIALQHRVTSVLCNAVGSADGGQTSAGKSLGIDQNGRIIGTLGELEEAMLILEV